MDLIDPEAVAMEDLVRRYLPGRVPQLTMEQRLPVIIGGGFLIWAGGLTILAATGIWTPLDGFSLLGSFLGSLCATAVGSEIVFRWDHRKQLARFHGDLATGALLGDVVERFREEIERYRSRTLGSNSDWARARDPLSKAKDEANRAVEYWSERAKDEDMAEVAEAKLALARTLEDKFGKAIAEIDERTEALRAFFNRCEAKLVPLETRRRDQEESERLARLSDQADVEIAEARRTINLIGRDFIDDVLLVANALGGLERLALLERAATVDVDRLEAVAERIVEASTADRRALDELEENLARAGGRSKEGDDQ